LTGLAPTGGATVTLSSGNLLVQVPSNVTVPAGAAYVTFTAQTSAVASVTNVTVTATLGGGSQNATLTLVPPLPFVSSLKLSPGTVNSGSPVTGTITLTAPAPLSGLVVNLSSNIAVGVAKVPFNVVITSGATIATFTVTTAPINFIAPATITASYNGTSQTALFTIVPPGMPLAPGSLSLNPLGVTGGTSATGTVLLTGPAPEGGTTVTLASDNAVVQVPLTLTVPAGANSAIFNVSTSPVAVISTATIAASLNGISQTSLLTVKPSGSSPKANPVPLLTLPLSPTSQTPGGNGFSLTIDGSGFVPGAQVYLGGTTLSTTVLSGLKLQATVPASSVQSNTSALVTVVNPGSGIANSNSLSEHITYARATPSFGASSLSVTGSPHTVAFGDLNRDGNLDLVLGNQNNGISVFLGNGDGTFGPERIVSLTPPMTSDQVAVGDLNGDGKLDIAVNESSGANKGLIGILLGNGDGTFTAMPDVSLPLSPGNNAALALGDLNGDGKLDLVVTGTSMAQAYVLLGNGDGTFAAPVSIGSVDQPQSLALADFNGDGKVDVALPDFNNKAVAIIIGNGDGTFQPQQEYQTNGYAGFLVVADFDKDGHPDIAVANEGPFGTTGSGIAILRNNGDGTFASPVTYGAGQNFFYLATDDFNGDGKLDLITTVNQPSRQALIFLGNGDSTFSAVPVSAPISTANSIAVADINSDGAPDLFVQNSGASNTIAILLQAIGPILTTVPTSLSFTAVQGGSNPTPIPLMISNLGGG
jgi:hypothetical protein